MEIRVIPLEVSHSDFKNYTYLAVDIGTGECVIIDPAWDLFKIDNAIGRNDAHPKGILVTHGHPDHVHLAGELSLKYQVPIYIDESEFRSSGLNENLDLRFIRNEGQLEIGSITVSPISTPGHTKGSVCYWIADALFSGDTLFTEGCGMCVDNGADPAVLFHSLQRLKTLVPMHTRIYPGHKYSFEIGKELSYLMKNNLYLQFDEVHHFVAFRMRKGQKGLFQFQ